MDLCLAIKRILLSHNGILPMAKSLSNGHMMQSLLMLIFLESNDGAINGSGPSLQNSNVSFCWRWIIEF